MRLLHFSLSAAAFGETFIGLSLAEQLRRSGLENHFVIPPVTKSAVEHFGFDHTVIDYADCPKGDDARAFVDGLIADLRPDALVLCDFNVFHRNVKFHFQLDPSFIEEYGLPILPIDLQEWEDTDFEIDLCGRDPLPVDRKILDYPAHLRPVPPSHVHAGKSKRAMPYRVVAPEEPVAPATRSRLRGELGLAADDKLLMVPISSWQRPPGGRGLWSDMMGVLADNVPDLLVRYLGQLPASTHFLVVGQPPPAFERLPGDRTHVMPPCSIDRYTELLGSSDGLLLLSPPSVTGGRAVLMDIPVLILQNRFDVPDKAAVEEVDTAVGGLTPFVRDWLTSVAPIEPFRMWPKGSFKAQQPMFTDNEYTTALVTSELLDETGTVSALRDLLYDAETQARMAKARTRYAKLVNGLPDTADVIREAIRRGGPHIS